MDLKDQNLTRVLLLERIFDSWYSILNHTKICYTFYIFILPIA